MNDFWRGFFSIFNIFGLEEEPEYLKKTDAEALQSDWDAVMKDLEVAMEKLKEEGKK